MIDVSGAYKAPPGSVMCLKKRIYAKKLAGSVVSVHLASVINNP